MSRHLITKTSQTTPDPRQSKTDWTKIDALTDAMIDYTDLPSLSELDPKEFDIMIPDHTKRSVRIIRVHRT